jgi:hypothetical protein
MFLTADRAIWMGLAIEDYSPFWDAGSVFLPADIREIDIHSPVATGYPAP